MPEPKFVHLRTHSAYSLSLGAMKVPDLVAKAKAMGFPAIGITDSYNMFGIKAFSHYAPDEGIKPIVGCEFALRNYDSDDVLKSKGKSLPTDKLIVFVKNQIGYQNIMKLMKINYLNNMEKYNEPQITLEDLHNHKEGLLVLSGGVDGPIGRLLLENRTEEAEDMTKSLHEMFPSDFYMEISRIGLDTEIKTENDFINLAYKYNIPLVATNEAFFFDTDMYEAHDALVCIVAGEYVSDKNRKRYSPNNRLKSTEEMLELFADLPEAIQNTVNIAVKCNFLSEFVSPLLPIFECPGGLSQDDYITQQAYKGLKERMEIHVYKPEMTDEEKKSIDEKYYARLEYELSVIKKMGFPGYFLIVSDFIQWSKSHGVPVGPGRGSGAGSIVAWSLKITDLDPIKLDLLFERFLNPERINMPDFDVDFCQENRGKTIEYVQNKYGFDHVAQIITYGKLQSKAVIRDVARVLQMPYSQADKISKMIPPPVQGKNVTLPQSLEMVPELKEMQENDPQINKLFDIAIKLEGLYRNTGVHAAGVVIGDRPLEQLVPLYKDPKSDMPVTQYDMKFVEETGLIKFDFLGLKTLTVIKKAVDMINKFHNTNIDISAIPLDDKPTYELMQRGDTAAVFQFESPGMIDVHKQIKPDRFEDLIAIVSLYRPGPMDNIPSYIKRKHGEEEITYLHPMLEPILKETYGIMIYQEQVMKIAQVLGGYTLGGADKLRKVMGKKQHDKIPEQREMFVKGAIKNGIEEQTAVNIFNQMEKFASYGFNKSHAAAYSLISYQTAWLKAHYMVEFMSAVMDLDITNTDKIYLYKEECKKKDIKVLPPDVNKSDAFFVVEDGNIRFALSAIKGVGEANMVALVEERTKNGPFKDLSDFIHRISSKQINRKQLENLIKAGAFDCFDKNRGKLFENIDLIIKNINASTEIKTSSQVSLFGGEELMAKVKLVDKPDWPEMEKLQLEAEVIGFYLSAHPLDSYHDGIVKLGVQNCTDVLKGIKTGDTIRAKIAGCVKSFQKRISKNGNRFAFLSISDATDSFEGILFSDSLTKYEKVIESGLPLLANVVISKESDDAGPRAIINSVELLDTAISEISNGLIITVNDISAIKKIKEILYNDKIGKNKVYIVPDNEEWNVKIELPRTFAFLEDNIFGKIRNVAGVSSVEEI